LRFSKMLSKSFLLLLVVLWNAGLSVGYAKPNLTEKKKLTASKSHSTGFRHEF